MLTWTVHGREVAVKSNAVKAGSIRKLGMIEASLKEKEENEEKEEDEDGEWEAQNEKEWRAIPVEWQPNRPDQPIKWYCFNCKKVHGRP